MFQKTPFKEQKASVFQEFKKEFSHTFFKGEEFFSGFFQKYPKQIFIGMVVLMIFSSIIALLFTPANMDSDMSRKIFLNNANEVSQDVSGEISTILDLNHRLKRISQLKAEIERIISLEFISSQDSIFLEKAIEELEFFNNQKHDQQ
jgi:hypothetical protein